MSVDARIAAVRARIDAAAEATRRDPAEVTLVAISKTFGADVILGAAAAGVTDFGENRAQEFRQKFAVIGDRVTWHFVGHLQTNKARHVVGSATLLHSVDRLGLAEEVARRARAANIVQDVLLEVNVAGEASKHGVAPAAARSLADRVASLDGLRLRGLMTIPPRAHDPQDSRPYFEELAALRDDVASVHPTAVELSMGMTQDFEVAIACGATIVRVGEAIFGPRR